MTNINGFTIHSGNACPLDKANVDTDQLIPKQFLTGVTRTGYGKHLFHDWRYIKGNLSQPNPDFILNKPEYADASILLARENFGCGSSREHAPWALADYGFKVIIATSFADIFYNNCINNQILPITLTQDALDKLFECAATKPVSLFTIDLPAQTITSETLTIGFEIPVPAKTRLLKGLDAIGQTLEHTLEISEFERRLPAWS
ncbi:3-isopropylmalate dehydratase small subunit [Alteromonas sp. ASW11-130]|uniref:3-isopropylmalate dehydratase small subunit n=1 Tax=Alteromonas sp. ASW11-130 TaxID=3015775 RepID=UPI0022426B92|nr:3-isopropylmalate dehydratase small subunit [Alteromonas sp. ASW11-130]MCW8092811.1 3-isopropylmalate dehydratase small subunit [Alteromonas sp. ASW11-130]